MPAVVGSRDLLTAGAGYNAGDWAAVGAESSLDLLAAAQLNRGWRRWTWRSGRREEAIGFDLMRRPFKPVALVSEPEGAASRGRLIPFGRWPGVPVDTR
jgi:hypothetical protein